MKLRGRGNYCAHESHGKSEKPLTEPVFGLSILGCCRDITVQHGGLCGREPAFYVNKSGSFQKDYSYFPVIIHLKHTYKYHITLLPSPFHCITLISTYSTFKKRMSEKVNWGSHCPLELLLMEPLYLYIENRSKIFKI